MAFDPPNMHCPMSSYLLTDPVKTPCNHTFQRIPLLIWIIRKSQCPVDRKPLTADQLTDDKETADMVKSALDRDPSLASDVQSPMSTENLHHAFSTLTEEEMDEIDRDFDDFIKTNISNPDSPTPEDQCKLEEFAKSVREKELGKMYFEMMSVRNQTMEYAEQFMLQVSQMASEAETTSEHVDTPRCEDDSLDGWATLAKNPEVINVSHFMKHQYGVDILGTVPTRIVIHACKFVLCFGVSDVRFDKMEQPDFSDYPDVLVVEGRTGAIRFNRALQIIWIVKLDCCQLSADCLSSSHISDVHSSEDYLLWAKDWQGEFELPRVLHLESDSSYTWSVL